MALKIPFRRTGDKDTDRNMLAIEQAHNSVDARLTSLEGSAVLSGSAMFTPLGGIAVRLINKTGSASVAGSLVSASTVTDGAFMLQANEYDTIGVVYENGIADGSPCYIVVSGVAQVLVKNTVAVTRGMIVIAADTDGRASAVANPGSGLPAVDTHFKECGHYIESKSAGTNVLAKAVIHFN